MSLTLTTILAACVTAADPAATEWQRYESTQIRMGVPVTITVYAPREEAANTAISAAFARIKELNDILSDYDPDSELMRLCRDAKPGQPVVVSPELFHVLTRAEDLSRRSDGAFDVTVGPVVQLWRKARRTKKLPDADELAKATALVGYRNVQLDAEQRTVELLKPGMRLDLGGIAKGYAADEAVKVLKKHGLSRVLVAAAGDIVAGEAPPGKTGWRVGIGAFENPEAAPKRHVLLANAAVSTSGDAFQFVEIAATRYSHIVDPKTGLGLTRRCSVTVVAQSGTASDGIASAVCVLGQEKGLKLVESMRHVEALFVEPADGERTRETASPGFAKLLAE
jgi:FAD:protein FMN transferase